MEKIQHYFKKALPYLLATLFFVVFSYIYFSPLLGGKALPQMDQTHALAMSKEISDYKAATGDDTQWTNSMFGGMPAYQISMGTSYNIYLYIQRVLRLGLPYTTVAILFIYMFGFYLLLLSLKFNNLHSVLGGIGFGLASYNIIIIAVGHITKTYAIAYMAPVIAGILLTYRGKYLLGGIITTFALGVEISTNHIQVMYYLGLMVLLLIIVMFIYSILDKEIKKFLIASGILVAAAVLALLPNITNLATTYEYGKESIRGKSELTDDLANKSSGLDRDYAYAWSYGVDETWNLLIPNVKGGASEPIGYLNEKYFTDVNPKYLEFIGNRFYQYFGSQGFTSGPVYLGAIMMFLFVLGIMIVRGRLKWWLLASAILGIVLSWGGNVSGFTDFLFYHLPMYNKFRTLSMSLVITGFAVALLAMFALKELIDQKDIDKKNKIITGKKLISDNWAIIIAFVLTGGISLLIYFSPSLLGDFLSGRDISFFNQLKEQQPNLAQQYDIVAEGVKSIRMKLVEADAIRSFGFVLLAALFVYLYSATKVLKKEYFILGLALIVVLDMWTIDKRYLNKDYFKSKSEVRNQFQMTKADEIILKDVDPDYRVLNLSEMQPGQRNNPFTDAYTSYFHKSIGGYHGAKLRRYQEIIDRYLGYEVQAISQAYDSDSTHNINPILEKTNILNMLNTKYILFGPNLDQYALNWKSLGNVWFVDDYTLVKNADEEIKSLEKINPAKTAIIDETFKDKISKLAPEFFSLDTGYIQLTTYKPNHLTYKSATKKERLAVFSEIYYDKGWNAYIDGFKTDYIRVNYILRGMVIPSGVHTIEFKFEPKTYAISQDTAIITSIIVLLALLAIIYLEYKKSKQPEKLEN
jgi:hypothetical protein